MFPPRTLQAKLLISVFFIVSLTVTAMTALVIYIEKEQFQSNELERIFYKADAMKTRLGHLLYGKNWRYLMMTLTNAKEADPSMLYFAVTDTEGRVIIADDETLIGKNGRELSRPADPDSPLYSRGLTHNKKNRGRLKIFLAEYGSGNADTDTRLVFEAVCDIVYLGRTMGQFRAGFSRQQMKRHLLTLTGGMLGTGMLVLFAVLAMIYLVIRNHMIPVESFFKHISGLDLTRSGRTLKRNLYAVPLKKQPGETRDVRQFKQAFRHLRDQFASAWDQLENHRDNLEQMVTERTRALNRSNDQLSRQIRERKEIEARILTVQKLEAIGTLAGGVAHEFNNLFMAITGYATLIQKRSSPGHPNVEKAEKIRRLVETGSRSVQQLLGFARSGKFSPGPLNLNEILRLSQVILRSSRKELTVETDYAGDLWTVQADRSQMEQVAMNLLLNAAEAMPPDGTVEVTTRNLELDGFRVSLEKKVSGRFVMLSVRDRGPGIDPEILPRIFDPFFTTKEMGQGTGMGLASVFGIVENHGGFTTADSAPGRGSTFCVYLPALDDTAPAAEGTS